VLTALDDFVAESDLDWKLVEVPGFHGCAVLAEAHLLSERPQLADRLVSLQHARFLHSQARLAEEGRLDVEVELAAVRGGSVAPPLPIAADEPDPLAAEEEEAPLDEPATAPQTIAPRGAVAASHPELIVDLAEQRAQREALEWRLSQLEADLSARDERFESLSGEREADRRDLIEARVRLEETTQRLTEEKETAGTLRDRLAELEGREQSLEAELREVVEREKLVAGRLSHREDALQAGDAEIRRLRAELERLRSDLGAGQEALAEVVRRIDAISETRWTRVGRRMRRMTSALGFGRRSEDPHALASAVARRALAAPAQEDVEGDLAGNDAELLEADVERRV
jgi:hypothetical protein